MPSRTALVILAVLLAAASIQPASAQLMDSFDAENSGTDQLDYTGFANFTVTQGSVDLIGDSLVHDIYPGNGLYVDLNGSSGVSGTIASLLSFSPGVYDVSFLLGNNSQVAGLNELTVTLGDTSESFSRTGAVPLELVEFQAVVTSSSPLVFATPIGDADNGGIIIDAVSVALVPEPAAIAGLLLVWAPIALRRRR